MTTPMPRKSNLTRWQWVALAVFAAGALVFATFASQSLREKETQDQGAADAAEEALTPAQLAALPMSPCVKSGMLSLADAVILKPSKLKEIERKCTGPEAQIRFQQREALKGKTP